MPAVLAVDLTISTSGFFSCRRGVRNNLCRQSKIITVMREHEEKSCDGVVAKDSPMTAHTGYGAKIHNTCLGQIARFICFCGKELTLA